LLREPERNPIPHVIPFPASVVVGESLMNAEDCLEFKDVGLFLDAFGQVEGFQRSSDVHDRV